MAIKMNEDNLDGIIANLLNADNINIDFLHNYNDSIPELYKSETISVKDNETIKFYKDTIITDKQKLVELINNKKISTSELVNGLKEIQKNNNNSLSVYYPKWYKKEAQDFEELFGTTVCFSAQQLGETLYKLSNGSSHIINMGSDWDKDICKELTEKINYYEDSMLTVIIDDSNLTLSNNTNDVFSTLEQLTDKIYSLVKLFLNLKSVKKINILYLYTTTKDSFSILLNSITGLLRNLCAENNKILCKTVDIGNTNGAGNVAQLTAREINSMGDYFEVSYSNEIREVKVLERNLPDYALSNVVKNEGYYVIIGGLGKIGLIVVKHLISCGASKVVLVGRRVLTEEENNIISSLNQKKEVVLYKKCDILQTGQVTKLFNTFSKQHGKLNGVFHSAGLIIDSLSINKEQANVVKVLEPKIKGTMNVVNAAQKVKADFVMLFSSLASVTGNVGQSDYGFANAFLDMYAEHESTSNSQTYVHSINWPLWEDGGMNVKPDRIKLMTQATGMVPLVTSSALLMIDTVIKNRIPRSMVFYGQSSKISKTIEPLCINDNISIVAENEKGIEAKVQYTGERFNISEAQKSKVTYSNKDAYYAVKEYLANALVNVAEIDIQTLEEDSLFSEFGLDSIMVEKLNSYFENDSLNLPKTILYEKNTLKDLSNYIIDNYINIVETKLLKNTKFVVEETKDTNTGSKGKDNQLMGEYKSIRNYIADILFEIAEIERNTIEDSSTFDEYGLDSIMVEKIHNCFENDGIVLPKTIMYERNNLMSLCNYILENHYNAVKHILKTTKEKSIIEEPIKYQEQKVKDIYISNEKEEKKVSKDIAIIGIDLKVSGAENAMEFWNNITNKKISITEVPKTKWNHNKFYSSDPNDTIYGKSYCNYGAFLEDADCFDGAFFNISPKEAEIMDPQERILLESVWRLLEDAGYTRDELRQEYKNSHKSGVGVFVGATNHSYALSAVEEWKSGNYIIPSSWQWAFANRISHIFDFTGPSIPVDTGCSSSMTALHLACKSIENGESSIAVVGGVNLYSHPTAYIGACKLKLLATTNEYRFLGADSDGFIPGEGVATIMLKPLNEAQKDNDKIYGIIKGTAINHSGHTNTFFAPSLDLQEKVVQKVSQQAQVDLATINYIELGTTGSSIGDPTEFRALTQVFKKSGAMKNSCAVGTVKPNIGHLESASGLVAVIKSLLQFKHNKLTPTLLADKVNPEINIENSPFYVSTEATEWLSKENNKMVMDCYSPKRALINSISAGGSYACAILEDYQSLDKMTTERQSDNSFIITISAKCEQSLKAYLHKFSLWLQQSQEVSMLDISMMFQLKREVFAYKIAFVCDTREELRKQVRLYLEENKLTEGVLTNIGIKLNSYDKSIYSGKSGKAFIKAIFQENDMKKLAYLWILEAKIDWTDLYQQKTQFNKIDLPSYQFEKERYWITELKESNHKILGLRSGISSMLDVNISTVGNICFSKLFTGEEFFIKDHLGILPAVAYIEMIYQAVVQSITDYKVIGIKNLVIMRPFIVKGEKQILNVRVIPQGDKLFVQVFSNGQQEIVYAQCNMIIGKQYPCSKYNINIEKLVSQMEGGENEALDYYSHLDRLNACFGHRFKGISKLYFRENEAVTEANLISSLKENKGEFNYHPTLLDAGFQTVVALAYKMGADPDTIYMPFVTEYIHFFDKCEVGDIKYIHVTVTQHNTEDPTKWKYRVEYLDKNYNRIICIENYSIMSINDNSSKDIATNTSSLGRVEQHLEVNEEFADVEEISDLHEIITNICMQTLKLKKKIDADTSLLEYGFDSITFTELSNSINAKLSIDTNPVLFFEKNTVNSIVEEILEVYPFLKNAPKKNKSIIKQSSPYSAMAHNVEAIYNKISYENIEISQLDSYKDRYAIIGMSGSFPGSSNIDKFWENIAGGKDLVTEIPKERWDWTKYDGKCKYGEYNIYAHSGGFIEDVDCFDAKFFKISPVDASIMDPQQRLILEHTWKSMEDAGYSSKDLKGTDTSIFIGVSNADYGELLVQRKIPTVLTHSMITNRVSYMLEITGKSEPCDSACSSSLLAVHRAIETIKSGESKMAFAGGVNLILSPNTYVYECLSQALSPTGTCKTFDESADGYVRGEGVGVILIKSLKDAIEDGDNIYATICGSAVQHAGKSTGLTVPNADAQAKVIEKAYREAGVNLNTVTYVETHGTGTKIGDPIEINGLKKAFSRFADEKLGSDEACSCALSSVKTNIGHLEAASGIASLIKTVKALENKVIPPIIHFQKLNPFIKLEEGPFFIADKKAEFKAVYNKSTGMELPRRAGVSSFGIGGVNAHTILEEYPKEKCELVASKLQDIYILPISAQNENSLKSYLQSLRDYVVSLKIESSPDEEKALLQRICYTFQKGRDAFNNRCGIIATNLSELVLIIEKILRDEDHNNYVLCDNIAKYANWCKEKCKGISESKLINNLLAENDYKELVKSWCCGIDIDWNQLYDYQKPHKMHLPTYPFKKDKYWIPDYYQAESQETELIEEKKEKQMSFKFINEVRNKDKTLFSSSFTESDMFLKEHVVHGKSILPGAVYSEIALEAASIAESKEMNTIKDMYWLNNIEASKQTVDLNVSVTKSKETSEVNISSDKLLAKGFVLSNIPSFKKPDIAELIDACTEALKRPQIYEQFYKNNIKFGKSLQSISTMWSSENYCVVQYTINTDLEGERKHILNPKVLDAAFQSVVGIKTAGFNNNEIRVPFYMKSLSILKTPEQKGFILSTIKDSKNNVDNYDIFIMDSNGNVNVVIEEYVVRKLLREKNKAL